MVDIKSALLLLALSVAAVNGQNCILTAPKQNLLSAKGLACPWKLSGGCTQKNPNEQTFVEATIYEPALNKIFAYSPLVIDKGSKPLVNPVVPNITDQAIIVYHIGSNADTVTLRDKTGGTTLKNAHCVNGLGKSVFNQVAYCNAPNFFAAATKGLQQSNQIPPLGNARDGSPCPTTRSFALVDQDQSDNVITTYLLFKGHVAQNTAINRKKFPKATVIDNGSDNFLLSTFVNPAVGCKSFAIPSLDNPGANTATLASDELLAAFRQRPPIALVPLSDPMTLVHGDYSLAKTNLYRIGVNQPIAKNDQQASPKAYCENLCKVGPTEILKQGPYTSKFVTPFPDTATTLFTYLGFRFNASWINLGCIHLTGKQSPIIANMHKGITTSLTFYINGKKIGPTTGEPTHHHKRKHHHKHHRKHHKHHN